MCTLRTCAVVAPKSDCRLIEPDPSRARFLLTVRGEGVRLADPAGPEVTLAAPRQGELVGEQVVGA